MANQLDDKVAVVTGAGSGIGQAIATALYEAGARVVAADISGAQDLTAKRLGPGARAVHADVTQGADVQAMLQTALDEFGRLDVVVNNAGIDGELTPLGECTEENYDRVMAVNARGVFLGMRYSLPILTAAGGGSIINIASIAGSVAFPTMSPYCASKGAILMLTRTAAAEYAATDVRINCICPGVVETALVDRLPAPLIEGATALTPMGRMGQPGEIAGAAVYLASDAASFVTGSSITIDGGYTTLWAPRRLTRYLSPQICCICTARTLLCWARDARGAARTTSRRRAAAATRAATTRIWRRLSSGSSAGRRRPDRGARPRRQRRLGRVDHMSEPVLLSEARGTTLVITINRPAARNCVDRAVAEAVAAALDSLDADPGLQVAVLTGAGGAFSAGMDLKAFARGESPVAGDRGFAGIVERSARKPLIAAIEGFALAGGLEIALACDLIVAARDARLGIPEVRVGLMAGAGGLLRLPRRVGVGQAALLALTGAPVSGEEGHRMGLVDRLVEPGQALAEALVLAETIGANAPLALAATKAVVTGGFGKSADEFWDWQRDHFRSVIKSADAREGAMAFSEKRPPRWHGR